VPVIASAGTIRHTTQELAHGPALVVGRKGGVGRVQLINGPFWPTDTTYYISMPEALSAEFLYYQISSLGLERLDRSTAVPSLQRQDLESTSLCIAPRAEQERIVAAIEEQLSRIDAGISAIDAVRQNLKRIRAAVLQAAVTGELVSQDRSATATKQLVEQLRHEVQTQGKRKTAVPAIQYLPSIPDSWQVVALADLAESIDYGTSEKTHADAKGIPILRMGNLGWGTIAYHGLKFLPRERLDHRLLLKDGDLLFNRTNSAELVGKTAVFHGYPEDIAFASYLIRVRPLPSADLDWANIVLNSAIGRRYVASVRNQQVGQANVNGTKLAGAPIPLPSPEEQSQIIAECERLFSVIDVMEHATAVATSRSARLRSSVLSTAFAGELVAQDANDEPASALLARIAAERASSNSHQLTRVRKLGKKVTV